MATGWSHRLQAFMDRYFLELSRPPMKEACTEFLGSFFLVACGLGVTATCNLRELGSSTPAVSAFGWGFAFLISLVISSGASGGHVNPAITLGLVVSKKVPWRHSLYFMPAQYFGSFIAACVVYLAFSESLTKFDGGERQLPPDRDATGQIFATYPKEFASVLTCLWEQVVGTALLLILYCAVSDQRYLRNPVQAQPFLISIGFTAILLGFSFNCGAGLNPARDLAPRIFTCICGWGYEAISYRNYTWFLVPVVGPYLGAVVGVGLYYLFVEAPYEHRKMLMEREEDMDSDDRPPVSKPTAARRKDVQKRSWSFSFLGMGRSKTPKSSTSVSKLLSSKKFEPQPGPSGIKTKIRSYAKEQKMRDVASKIASTLQEKRHLKPESKVEESRKESFIKKKSPNRLASPLKHASDSEILESSPRRLPFSPVKQRSSHSESKCPDTGVGLDKKSSPFKSKDLSSVSMDKCLPKSSPKKTFSPEKTLPTHTE